MKKSIFISAICVVTILALASSFSMMFPAQAASVTEDTLVKVIPNEDRVALKPMKIRIIDGALTVESVVEKQETMQILEESEPKLVLLGEFMITAYCCEKYEHICGTGTGITKSGEPVTPDVSIGVDPKVIPLGTKLYIEGVGWRVAHDIGGAIKENRIDVAVDTHENALRWVGYGKHNVWILV